MVNYKILTREELLNLVDQLYFDILCLDDLEDILHVLRMILLGLSLETSVAAKAASCSLTREQIIKLHGIKLNHNRDLRPLVWDLVNKFKAGELVPPTLVKNPKLSLTLYGNELMEIRRRIRNSGQNHVPKFQRYINTRLTRIIERIICEGTGLRDLGDSKAFYYTSSRKDGRTCLSIGNELVKEIADIRIYCGFRSTGLVLNLLLDPGLNHWPTKP